jgi:hypothetical protein
MASLSALLGTGSSATLRTLSSCAGDRGIMRTVGTSESGAIFSDDMKYRYRLWRCWNPDEPRACFILLNPSTADEITNDPTVERQKRRVESWAQGAGLFGETSLPIFGAIEIVNAFALRSTDPAALYEVEDPIGDGNGDAILCAAKTAIDSLGIVLCGWGSHVPKVVAYAHDCLIEMLENERTPLCALKLNQDGTPQHPLYLPYSLMPRKWIGGELKEEVF